MKKIKVELENCYGIKSLSHEFNFEEGKIAVVYAPNGTMKTSFAKTFRDINTGDKPSDRVYGLESSFSIKINDEKQIDKEDILVISAFDEMMNAEQGKLMVDIDIQKKYVELHKKLESEKDDLLSKVKEELGYSTRTKFSVERQLCIDFGKSVKEIYGVLQDVQLELQKDTQRKFTIDMIDHNVIFDAKALKLFEEKESADLIAEYSKKYSELVEKSKFLRKGTFDHRNFLQIANTLKMNGYFEAEHKVLLNNKDGSGAFPPIESEEELNRLLEEEKEKVLNDKELKAVFDKISKDLSSKKETRALESHLQQYPELILELKNVEQFKKDVWFEVFRKFHVELSQMMRLYLDIVDELKTISDEANSQRTQWEEVINLFHDRFFVPFRIEPRNQVDVILRNEVPTFEYSFEESGAEKKSLEQGVMLNLLSTGEKRAYYLLNLIYQVKIRANEGIKTLIVLDDIVDSFDYKNKYAIIEYLKDITEIRDKSGNKLFSIIALSHNFDFYRTVGSRIALAKNCFIASKKDNGIKLTSGQYTKNYFNHVKKKCIEGKLEFVIAAIPFVRNLIEYTYSKTDEEYKDYNTLTDILHIKENTHILSLKDVEDIFNRHWLKGKGTFANECDESIYNLVFKEANNIEADEDRYLQVNIENKVVLSMAIRLKAEEVMIKQIKDFVKDGQKIVEVIQSGESQTGKLCRVYKENRAFIPNDKTKLIEQVAMMTAENIHINSFMYEPILDMHGLHLVKLYQNFK